MRTRQSNRSKRFTYSADIYGLGSDDEQPSEPAARRVSRHDAEDANFGDANGGAEMSEEDDDDAGFEAEEALGELVEESVAATNGDGDAVRVRTDNNVTAAGTPRKRKKMVRKRRPEIGNLHDVSLYPADMRHTRVYAGPIRRWTRHWQLGDMLWGADPQHKRITYLMLKRWFTFHVLPSRLPSDNGGVIPSPWMAEDFEAHQQQRITQWYGSYAAAEQGADKQRTHRVPPKHAQRFVSRGDGSLATFLGPHHEQTEFSFEYGKNYLVSETGLPVSDSRSETRPARGWILDVEGIVVSMSWAHQTVGSEQLLALAVIPQSDQEYHEADESGPHDEKRDGCVQVWRFRGDKDERGVIHPSSDHPQMTPDIYGLIAILCGDGQVRVLSVPVPKETTSQATFDWVDNPIATLGFTGEYSVSATCLTWVGINRICLGHSDGTIALWSIYPRQILVRHSVHLSCVLDISSGYPSRPYMIATTPVGGCQTVTDLSMPSAESTYIPMPAVTFQPNLLDWNDHMQGFFVIYPTPTPHNTIVGFNPVRHHVQSRTMYTGPSQPTCISAGKTHPFILIGCTDGSLWAMNGLKKLLVDRNEEVYKMRIFQHEHRPVRNPQNGNTSGRGAARIVQGFAPELNVHARTEQIREWNKKRAKDNKHKKSKAKLDEEEREAMMSADEQVGGKAKGPDTSRAAIHELRTRITTVAWNPNIDVGWWAAVAMGSGLVKVMDLGVE